MNSFRKQIRKSLFAAFRVNYIVRIVKDPAGYLADATTDKRKGKDRYFFAYGKTKPQALAGLSAAVEGCFRRRLDRYKTGLNTLIQG